MVERYVARARVMLGPLLAGWTTVAVLVVLSALTLAVVHPSFTRLGSVDEVQTTHDHELSASIPALDLRTAADVLTDQDLASLGLFELVPVPASGPAASNPDVAAGSDGRDARPGGNDPGDPDRRRLRDGVDLRPVLTVTMTATVTDAAGQPVPPADDGPVAASGDQIDYSITVTNVGGGPSRGSLVLAHIPDGTTYVRNTCGIGIEFDGNPDSLACMGFATADPDDHGFVALTGPISPGQHAVVGFRVLVNPDAEDLPGSTTTTSMVDDTVPDDTVPDDARRDGPLIVTHAHAHAGPTTVSPRFESPDVTVRVVSRGVDEL